MFTPCTMTRFARWRVRDWASCFLACRFSLDDEHETFHNSSSQLPIRNMVLEMKKDGRGNNKRNKKLSKKNKKFRQVNLGSNNSTVPVQNCNSRDSSRPQLQEEEYIVFCFGEDGEFDVVKECKAETLQQCFDTADHTSPNKSANGNLHCVEVSETARNSSNQKKPNLVNEHEKEITTVKKDDRGEGGSDSGPEAPCNARTRWYQIGETDNGMVSAQSSDSNQSDRSDLGDSNQSDGSTGSFSFPVMHWELIGSPAQMPRSENLYARKHKPPCARFQCCRF